ncbi:capping complex subunit for YIEGIA [Falsibacillus pallidus]|uniref:Uncharacterized protein n=1 Tax=Falsibacillus pallidus TaxID=493781 RepID=A0A370G8G3_9BACI|nr:hypothetical protein [Falsibacillus pallidus]RDI40088.1 hypothetical protein DFR59_1124 [Falsibacillus pallidus]
MNDLKIYAFIGLPKHTEEVIYPGDAVLLLAKDEDEQQVLMRDVALAVRGDVVKLSNGLIMIVTADR